MGDRTILCGSVHLSKAAFTKAQDTALLEMTFMASDDPDEMSCVMKGVKAKDLFASDDDDYRQWAKNTYDSKGKQWVFGASLHDDDLPNANTDGLPKSLSALKDQPGTDFVFAYAMWSGQLERAWRVDKDGGGEVEELPKLPKSLSDLIAEGKYEAAVSKVSALLLKASEKQAAK